MSGWSHIGDVVAALGMGRLVGPTRQGPDAKAAFARMLRSDQTIAERHMATVLAYLGIEAIPQAPILGWIADFYDPATRTVIEVDGDVHARKRAYDRFRDEKMEAAGYRVLRVRNEEVDHFLANIVLDRWAA